MRDSQDIKNVHVMCVGNILLMDEGVGPQIARTLLDMYEFPNNVEVADCATLGLSLVGIFKDRDLVICVDAVDGTGSAPGTVFTYRPEDMAARSAMPSAHGFTLLDVIDAARMLGYDAEVRCVGIQVACMNPAEYHIGLSPEVQAAVEKAAQTVVSLLLAYGVRGIVDRAEGKEVKLL